LKKLKTQIENTDFSRYQKQIDEFVESMFEYAIDECEIDTGEISDIIKNFVTKEIKTKLN